MRVLLLLLFCLWHIFGSAQYSDINGRLNAHPEGERTSLHLGDTLVTISNIDNNVHIGAGAGIESTSQRLQTFVGAQAGLNSIFSHESTALGYQAGKDAQGHRNTHIGALAGRMSNGARNTYVGFDAGAKVVGEGNVIMGYQAGPSSETMPMSNRLIIHNDISFYPLVYGEFDNRLFTIYHNASGDTDVAAATGLRIQRLNTVHSWTQHVRSDGTLGFYFGGSGSAKMTLSPNGDLIISGTLNPPSDVNRKELIIPVDQSSILRKVKNLPISTWYYKDQEAQHIGPMAQDFSRIFGYGDSDTSIATVDADGVALAAIQALAKENEQLKEQVSELFEIVKSLQEEVINNK